MTNFGTTNIRQNKLFFLLFSSLIKKMRDRKRRNKWQIGLRQYLLGSQISQKKIPFIVLND